MARMNGGEALAAALAAEGIEHLFGIVGTHNNPLFDGAHRTEGLTIVTTRHEQGAALMACGYARASGRIAACIVVPGPGLTNALTGMGMAYAESAPMLVVAGQNSLVQLEREGGHFHELNDSLSVAGAVSGYTARVSSPEDVAPTVREAMRAIRCRRPRPAYLEIPLDVQTGEADIVVAPPPPDLRPAGDPEAIERAARALDSAARPLVFAGGGANSPEAAPVLTRVAERLGAPVVTSVSGRGAISDRHPLALGGGWGRLTLYDELLDAADLVLVVGSTIDVVSDARLGQRFPARVVQIDIDPLIVGQRCPVEAGVVGDAARVLEALATALGDGSTDASWFDVEAFRRSRHQQLARCCAPVMEIVRELRDVLPHDAIVVDDLTLVGYWMPLLLDTFEPRTLIHPGTYGTLGYSLPAAIGAKLACPGQTVVSVSGDGGFMFNAQELATARALDLDLIALVFNDDAFGAIRTYQDRLFGNRRVGSELVNPDFPKLAGAYGVQGVRVAPDAVADAVRRARDAGGVWLIEVPFSPGEPASRVPWMP